ncbi:MAG: hypothetical protein H7Y04_04380 [Verrucomicrobia bacterium]|nr:hypothetical protein [Cytophagales bacterium]
MKDTLYSKMPACRTGRHDCLEVVYEYNHDPGTSDTPPCTEIDIIKVQAMDSSIDIQDLLCESVIERIKEEIQEQEENRDNYDESAWEERKWAA